jgi:murein DD-endopeptidase MepM/ murein hydrolase activator NlpD
MSRTTTPSLRTVGTLIALILGLGASLVLLAGGVGPARAASPSQLRQRISAGQGQVSALSGAVSSANQRVNKLNAGVAALESQVMRLQADLNAKRTQLLALRSELAAAKTRLAQLEAAEAHAQQVLSQQLVGSYEADRPDLVSVVLEATGFNNLLERLSFEQRIGHQDAQIVGRVRAARRAVAAQATRLGVLSERQQRLTTQVLYERNRVARDRIALVDQQIAAVHVRNAKAGELSAARGQLASLHSQLSRALAAQAAAARRAQQSAGSGSPSSAPSGPITPSSRGGFTFPMPKADASPPSTWSLDDGVDISAPGGTPELAVCSGTVVLHGIGGFGPSAPVIHCDSPLAGYDYVYYGHAGPGNWTAVGTHVGQGQVISQVGYGIVGISTGPHLEIGFADSSGSPVGPSSAPAMMALLRGSY